MNRWFAFVLTAVAIASAEDTPALRKLDWGTMREFNYRTGRITSNLKTYDGARVWTLGYAVPLEGDEAKSVTEFLLVPHDGACIHVPPPPPNQMIYVRMAPGARASVKLQQAFRVEGRLKIATTKSAYGEVGFELRADKVEPYRP